MMRYLTHLGGARATIGASLLLIAGGGAARDAGMIALIGNALSHAAVQVLKRTVRRPRPCDAAGVPLALVELPDPFSFPSGHSAAAFAVGLPVAAAFPWAAPPVLALAGVIAWSRVALRVHHASDTWAGALLGTLGYLSAGQLL